MKNICEECTNRKRDGKTKVHYCALTGRNCSVYRAVSGCVNLKRKKKK